MAGAISRRNSGMCPRIDHNPPAINREARELPYTPE
jgi:hypothetical protein